MKSAAAVIAVWLAFGSIANAVECSLDQLTVVKDDGPFDFFVEVARTPDEQARGLMFRSSLDRDAGMIFIMEPERQANFWMRNTMISLDLIFIERSGRVESVAANAIPYSEKKLSSQGPVRAVLEINGGLSASLGIVPGVQIVHPAFDEAPAEYRCSGS